MHKPPTQLLGLCYCTLVMFTTKTKIVATLGPNSTEVSTITKMIKAGLSVARINMSHGDFEEHAGKIKNARTAAKKAGRPIAILQDLSGPKIRIGDFETELVTLEPGKALTLTTKKCVGTAERVHVNYAKLPKEVEVGMDIYLNDGKQKLTVTKIADTEIYTTIMVGGTIRGRRGVNIPDGNLSISSLTPKDRKDLKFGLEQGVNFMTLSFVRTAADLHLLRKLIATPDIAIVAKIETKAAIENLDEIVDAADVIMVARGDLAIEMPIEQVPLLQKRIIETANRRGKPVITATQMLDSMRIASTPTRAEVTDIANAIIDGTDAIMLSDETAVGEYPVEAVATMTRVAQQIESDEYLTRIEKKWDFKPESNCDAVSRSIARSVKPADACAIIALTESGYTGRMVARYRPQTPIMVLTPHESTFLKMRVVYGCEPVKIKPVKNIAAAKKAASKVITDHKLGKKGDTYVMGAGIPFGSSGATNLMLIETVA